MHLVCIMHPVFHADKGPQIEPLHMHIYEYSATNNRTGPPLSFCAQMRPPRASPQMDMSEYSVAKHRMKPLFLFARR